MDGVRLAYKHNGQTIYEWEQSLEDVNVYLQPPPYTLPKYLAQNKKTYGENFVTAKFEISIKADCLAIGVKGQKPFINVG